MRWIIVLLCCFAFSPDALRGAAPATQPSWPKREVPDFNVMNNDDGDWLFRGGPDPAAARRGMERAIDELGGTSVRTHVQCVALGSDVMYYPTKVASVVGWGPLKKPQDHVARVKAGMDAGIDPIRVVAERAKRNGLKFIPSYRLNDAHFAREPDGHYATGKFWVDHHEKMAMPNNRLDFSHAEVRAFRAAIIDEVIDRYADVSDGLELDFTRHGMFFPAADAAAKAPLLTQMVAGVRARLDEAEKKHGRPLYLVVRVWATLEDNAKSGVAVESWIARRLIDVVVPAQLYSTSFDMPIGQLVALAKPAGVKVYPCFYERTVYQWPLARKPAARDYAGDPTYRPSPMMYAGAAATYRALGADGFEMYNFRAPLGVLGLEVQRLLASPAAALGSRDRAYAITPAEGSAAKLPTFQNRSVIPAKLAEGTPLELELLVGDDPTAKGAPRPAEVVLRLGFSGSSVNGSTTLRVRLNGTTVHDGPLGKALIPTNPKAAALTGFGTPPGALFQFALPDASAVMQGFNRLQIEAGGELKDASIVEVQLGLFYDDPFNTRI